MSPFSALPRPETVSQVTLADGTQRVVWRQGTGRPLLLIQGMSGSHYEWGESLVESLEAANAKVQALGGKVIVARIEVPVYGAFSVVQDPTGAQINLFQPNRG